MKLQAFPKNIELGVGLSHLKIGTPVAVDVSEAGTKDQWLISTITALAFGIEQGPQIQNIQITRHTRLEIKVAHEDMWFPSKQVYPIASWA